MMKNNDNNKIFFNILLFNKNMHEEVEERNM